MDDSLNPLARQATHEAIIAKRDRLLALRQALLGERSELLARLRRADRELSDCRAAARLFDLDIEFPDEEEAVAANQAARREREMLAERERRDRIQEYERRAQLAMRAASAAPSPPPTATPESQPALVPAKPTRPSIKEVVLEQLRSSSAGLKAAEMRDYIERTYGDPIHEKTVGMTLYRLSKGGLVRRDGHTWFLGAASAETRNPGGETPGFNGLLD